MEQFNKNWTVEVIVEGNADKHWNEFRFFLCFVQSNFQTGQCFSDYCLNKNALWKTIIKSNLKNKKRVDRKYNNNPIASANGQTSPAA